MSTTSLSSCAPGGPCLQYRLRLVVQFPVLTVRGADVDAPMLSAVLASSILRERTDPQVPADTTSRDLGVVAADRSGTNNSLVYEAAVGNVPRDR